jgi:diguanylate cyclase (GGDEF)-like protein
MMVKQVAELFGADDCFFALWDETSQNLIPMIAYGSASDVYPSLRFDPDEPVLSRLIMDSGKYLAIPDFENSPYHKMARPRVNQLLNVTTRSLLGVPLIAHEHKLGIMFLSYQQLHEFTAQEIDNSVLAGRQIALTLSRAQLLEEAERRVKELAVLHEIALASTQVESEDQLLERATEIIGKNLYPHNFGILLLDIANDVLLPHPSYRVYATQDYDPRKITVPLGQGVTGQVAQSGQPCRVGDIHQIENYMNIDSRTQSELCVPIKSKGRVLGVINAESMELNAFTANDENLMITLAGQLATALEYLRSLEGERHWMGTLAHSNELISALSHITTQIERVFSPSEVMETVEREFQKLGLASLPSAYLRDKDQMAIQYDSLLPDSQGDRSHDGFEYRVRAEKMESLFGIENVLAPMVLPEPLKSIELILGDFSQEVVAESLRAKGVTAKTEIIHLPLLFEDRLLGALWLWGKDLTRADLPVMSIFARQMAITLENARLFEEVQNLALTDPLTGLYNRRGLFEIGRIEFARSRRAGRAFSAIMLDIDRFKQVNDTYGHVAGDKVLQKFAAVCRDSIREVDLIGRYGGEEIVILLPETDLAAGVEVAERLRKAILSAPAEITPELSVNVTASLGVAQQDDNTLNLETLIARADQAMYIAKHKGRDRIAMSS